MTPQEELELALAELAAANAELAAAEAGLAVAEAAAKKQVKKPAKATKPKRRTVHHPESDLRSECYGVGHRFTSDGKVRVDMTPVVTKEIDAMDRQNDPGYAPIECLLIFDVRNGFMDSDSWQRCKCAGCADIRRG